MLLRVAEMMGPSCGFQSGMWSPGRNESVQTKFCKKIKWKKIKI